MTEPVADIGLVGLGVMGRNLVLNIEDHGYAVTVYNRTGATTDEFLSGEAAGRRITGVHTLEELVGALRPPRKVVLMIRAGDPVDATIDSLLPLLSPGDIIIDGGNSRYTDTMRRTARVEAAGMLYVGTGVSGGEEGARHGPSLMPGGSAAAWPEIEAVFTAISAQVDGEPVTSWVGPDGAGHYVKMVHNGIEYGDMQVIAEAYDLMHRGLGMDHDEIGDTFSAWDQGPLDSYLTEITAEIMRFRDDDGSPLIEHILDAAGQKGTGKWTVVASLEEGQPMTLVAEAVYARIVSALVTQRRAASQILTGPEPSIDEERDGALADIHDALYASKIVSYAQGFMLLAAASAEHDWKLDFAAIAHSWRGGAIIRSRFLTDIMDGYRMQPEVPSLMVSPFFSEQLRVAEPGWRRTVGRAVAAGIPVPAYASALTFFDGYRTGRLPANLIQAQRDYFGAHTYERIDQPRGEFFHTDWTGHGGDVSSTTYNV